MLKYTKAYTGYYAPNYFIYINVIIIFILIYCVNRQQVLHNSDLLQIK
jgi:hypothetical protein